LFAVVALKTETQQEMLPSEDLAFLPLGHEALHDESD
jgi:hypothetical protein